MSNNSGRKEGNKNNRSRQKLALVVLLVILAAVAFALHSKLPSDRDGSAPAEKAPVKSGTVEYGPANEDFDIGNVDSLDADHLPEYDGHHYVTVNGNVPVFPEEVYGKASLIKDGDKYKTEGNLFGTVDSRKLTPYEYYGSLDSLGRCTCAYGCLGEETMPEEGEERGDISEVHPSGWASGQNWERSHLIAWALGAENANPENLVTGTHYFNSDGMRPLEEDTEHYIWDTGNHVLYMVIPMFSGDELIPRGVQMIVRSVEDNGEGISFNVYCFNVTPNATINYNTGIVTTEEQAAQDARLYVINKRSGVFHYPSCSGAQTMAEHNREEITATRSELIEQGYTPCGQCEP